MVKRHYGISTKRYKLIHFYYDIDEWELYDLKEDPNEMNNVYHDPAYAEVRAIYLIYRSNIEFAALYHIQDMDAFFVSRAKSLWSALAHHI